MRDWQLKPGDPLYLTFAADACLGATSFVDDHIWEFSIRGGDPPGMVFTTSFGLRARSFKILPRFSEKDETVSDPSDFLQGISIINAVPNYLHVHAIPFEDIDAHIEYWVPQSDGCCGRVRLNNSSLETREIRIDWVVILIPTEGQRMGTVNCDGNIYLAGQTANLFPVFMLSGDHQAGSGAYPILGSTYRIPPGASVQSTWSEVALTSLEASLQVASDLLLRKWDAEMARIEIQQNSKISIETGNPDWDAVLSFSQNLVFKNLVSPTQALPNTSYVLSRQPDQGYSILGNGKDYAHHWDGQTTLDLLFLCGFFLPSHPKIVEGLVENFFSHFKPDGFVDFKPGLAGHESRLSATPILAAITWKIFESTQNIDFLSKLAEPILQYLSYWFTQAIDADRDGYPEWEHPMQIGWEDHPTFSHWQVEVPTGDIRVIESPELGALLYRECQDFIKIAEIVQMQEIIPTVVEWSQKMQKFVQKMWDPDASCYRSWDRDSHLRPKTKLHGIYNGSGNVQVDSILSIATRFILHFTSKEMGNRRPTVILRGRNLKGRFCRETIEPRQIQWLSENGYAVTENVFSTLSSLQLEGLSASNQVALYYHGCDFLHSTSFLTLWSEVADPTLAHILIEKTLLNPQGFWQSFGIPSVIELEPDVQQASLGIAHIPLVTIVCESLVKYGYLSEAVALFGRLMDTVGRNLKQNWMFFGNYRAGSGIGMGERNAITGAVPTDLFLLISGIKIISPTKIILSGFNPFMGTISVSYRGLKIVRLQQKTFVTFPNGSTIEDALPEPHEVSQVN